MQDKRELDVSLTWGFPFLSLLPLTRMYKHPEAVHIKFVGNDRKGEKKNTYIKNMNCSLLHALASVQEAGGFTQNSHITL